ncbi:CST complex subunit CTC1 [Glycine soja]|nr:CST complex subunit CTC1 [Glycine soja]
MMVWSLDCGLDCGSAQQQQNRPNGMKSSQTVTGSSEVEKDGGRVVERGHPRKDASRAGMVTGTRMTSKDVPRGHSDENLLKLIIFNACVGGIWNVVASGMDAEEIRELEKEYLTEMVNVQNMQNIWTKEVSYPRTLAEARNMIQELLIS